MKSSVAPSTRTRLCRLRSPATIVTARLGTSSALARSSISSALAAPSTGAALSRTSTASPRVPAIPDLPERGMTLTLISALVKHEQYSLGASEPLCVVSTGSHV